MWRRALGPALRASRASLCSRSLSKLHTPSPLPLVRAAGAAFPHSHRRFLATQSSDNDDAPTPSSGSSDASEFSGAPGVESPGEKFVMVYTCSVCETRSAKTISKHAYYKGVVLVRCPGCENLHLVADRLGWFEDDGTDVETLLQQKGETVRFVTGEDVLELTENDILGKNDD